MPKNKQLFNDFDELLAKSQRLVTGIGANVPSRNVTHRGVAELNLASKDLSQGAIDERSYLEASRLLSQKNFDAQKLNDDVNSIVIKNGDESLTKLEGTDIEGYLAHHHDLILLAAIDEARRESEEDLEEMQRRWSKNEWSAAKAQFMDSFGHRAYQWGGDSRDPASSSYGDGSFSGMKNTSRLAISASSPYATSQSQAHSHQMMAIQGPSAALSTSFRGTITPTPKKYFGTPGTTDTYLGDTTSNKDILNTTSSSSTSQQQSQQQQRPFLSEFLRQHATLIHSLKLLSSSIHESNRKVAGAEFLKSPCKELANAIQIPPDCASNTVVTDGLTKADLIAYRSLLSLLSFVLGEERDLNSSGSTDTPAGFFSSVCFEACDVFANVLTEKRNFLSGGAKQYLENQVWELWHNAVDQAVHNGDLPTLLSTHQEGTSRLQRLRTYVAYQARLGNTPVPCCKVLCPSTSQSTAQNPPVPLWSFVYHCLRVGDVKGALDQLIQCVSSGYNNGEQAAMTVLRFIDMMAAKSVVSAAGTPNKAAVADLPASDLKALNHAMSQCQALYAREINSHESHMDCYKAAALNLLGLADRDGLSNPLIPGSTLEDFLWSHLWFIQTHRLMDDKAAAFLSNLVNPTAFNASRTEGTSCGEIELFELIQDHGGADYFDQDRSTPFKYAIVLFCCQRYGDAIAHLYTTNKIVAAVQLSALCLHFGLILPFMPLCQNPYHPLAVSSGHLARASTGSDPTPWTVLLTFAQSNMISHYPEIGVDYLMCLDSNWLSFAQGLESKLKDTSKLKSQSVVASSLEAFIATLSKDMLTTVVGQVPPEDSSCMRTSDGRLDEYMEAGQIESLLCRIAYHLLTQQRETERAIYLYQLAGRFSEVVTELCNQLSSFLVPSAASEWTGNPSSQQPQSNYFSSQREFWLRYSEHFVSVYLSEGSSSGSAGRVRASLSQGGHMDCVEALHTLLSLYRAVDAFMKGGESDDEVLALVDSWQLLPVTEDHIAACSAVRPQLKRVLDDALCLTAETVQRLFHKTKTDRATRQNLHSGKTFSGLTTDRDLKLMMLKTRARVLLEFASRNKGRSIKLETALRVAKVEASLI